MCRKQRILFVDDEPKVLRGLRRSMEDMVDVWEMAFANSGAEALDLMARSPFDIIVSDMQMPGMSGVALLKEVRRLYPHTVRIALSGQASKESVLNGIGPIHQYLPKPCDMQTLQATLSRLWSLRDLLAVDKLQSVLAQLEHLPSLPSLYKELMAAFESPESSLGDVGRIVGQDMGMSAKVLQLVNSAFFGMPREVTCPAQAVASLGMDTVRSLALAVCVFAPFEQQKLEGLSLESLWSHSVTASIFAKQIAQAESLDRKSIELAYVAALLHDVGKLVLSWLLPDDYLAINARVRDSGVTQTEAECAVVGAGHAQLGAYLLGLWGFPLVVIQAVAYHHEPGACPREGRLTSLIVHVANALAHDPCPPGGLAGLPAIDHAAIETFGSADCCARWVAACLPAEPAEVS